MTLDPEAMKRAGDLCKKCRQEIIWATTRPKDPKQTGKPIPLNPELVIGGNVLVSVDDAGMLIARVVAPAATVEAYVTHFTTCEFADEFRKPVEGASHEEQNEARRRALQVRFPFGQYVGKTLEEIDRDRRGHEYLAWALKEVRFQRTDVKQAIAAVLGVES